MSSPGTLTDFPTGSTVSGMALVTAMESRSYGEGKECVVLTLSDRGGQIESAPFWPSRQPLLAGVRRGTVVAVSGQVGSYRGRRQLEIAGIAPVAGADPVAYLPTAGDPAPLWARLDAWRGGIRGPRLAGIVGLFYDDAEFRRRYGQCPASTAGHHACVGGLLQHTCEVAAIGLAIAATSGADPDLVLAGALLHDIGKLEAYRWDTGFETTDAGALLGHVALGLLMLSRRVAAGDVGCSAGELLLLQHLIGSHHGRVEFGAVAPPMTLEAEVLHFADDASAKSAAMAGALSEGEHFDGEALLSSRGVWQLDRRRVYRGASDWGAKKERPTSRG